MEQTPDEGRITDKVKAAIVLFLSLLDERQRRIYAGLEALKVIALYTSVHDPYLGHSGLL